MARVAQGDPDAADLLVSRYKNMLFAFLYRLTVHHSDSEDIFQETWLRVIRYRHTYHPGKKFSTWLFQIALNCTRDYCKSKKNTVAIDVDPVTITAEFENLENQEMAEKLLQHLSLSQREVVVLKFFHGMKEVEIASLLEIPLGTVKSRLHKSIHYLKNYFGDKEYARAMDG